MMSLLLAISLCLADAAMSLAAEDEEESMRFPSRFPSHFPSRFPSSSQGMHARGLRQQHFATDRHMGSGAGAGLTDPFALLHPTLLLGHSRSASQPNLDAAYAMMASLMTEYDEPNGAAHIGAGTGIFHNCPAKDSANT